MVCQFERLIYPNSAQNVDLSSFMIASYRPCEKVYDLDGNLVSSVKAVGYCLPISGAIRYNMQGKWNKNAKKTPTSQISLERASSAKSM